jgi:hypothetical protein
MCEAAAAGQGSRAPFTSPTTSRRVRTGEVVDSRTAVPLALCMRACVRACAAVDRYLPVSGRCLFLPGALVSCEDGVRNGNEAGVDCGGPNCPSCRYGALDACVNVATYDVPTVVHALPLPHLLSQTAVLKRLAPPPPHRTFLCVLLRARVWVCLRSVASNLPMRTVVVAAGASTAGVALVTCVAVFLVKYTNVCRRGSRDGRVAPEKKAVGGASGVERGHKRAWPPPPPFATAPTPSCPSLLTCVVPPSLFRPRRCIFPIQQCAWRAFVAVCLEQGGIATPMEAGGRPRTLRERTECADCVLCPRPAPSVRGKRGLAGCAWRGGGVR